jgi:hypothetical protein
MTECPKGFGDVRICASGGMEIFPVEVGENFCLCLHRRPINVMGQRKTGFDYTICYSCIGTHYWTYSHWQENSYRHWGFTSPRENQEGFIEMEEGHENAGWHKIGVTRDQFRKIIWLSQQCESLNNLEGAKTIALITKVKTLNVFAKMANVFQPGPENRIELVDGWRIWKETSTGSWRL